MDCWREYPAKRLGVHVPVEVLHSSYHGILESGGVNEYHRHSGSSTAHTRDIEISRPITTEVLAATESVLVALSSHYRNNSYPHEAAISESKENHSAIVLPTSLRLCRMVLTYTVGMEPQGLMS